MADGVKTKLTGKLKAKKVTAPQAKRFRYIF
jgi:phosphatidylcholine synthase